jgi:hypothetical protein
MAYEFEGLQINFPAQQAGQFNFHEKEFESWCVARLKFNQHVDVTIRVKVFTYYGTKAKQSANMVALAELLDHVTGKKLVIFHKMIIA